jgi:uncharacterized protein YbjQ (UPF0145 family)
MEQIIIFLALIALGYTAGTITEKKHFKSLVQREKETLHLPAVTIKNAFKDGDEIKDAKLVLGSVVISIDYFKRVLASLRNIFGGEVMAYETLVDRARREAILRMKKEAKGYDIILNTRIETSSIGKSANKRRSVGSVEALAYGTAVALYKNGSSPI